MRVQPQHVPADLAETVNILLAWRAPVDELDAELAGGLRLVDHLQYVDAGERHVVADMRDSGFADSDGADLLGLDEVDFDLAQPLRQHCRRHPSGSPASNDRNLAYRLIRARQNRLRCSCSLEPLTPRLHACHRRELRRARYWRSMAACG